jgi:hypothetical protein
VVTLYRPWFGYSWRQFPFGHLPICKPTGATQTTMPTLLSIIWFQTSQVTTHLHHAGDPV